MSAYNSLLITIRSVTFLLQKEKALLPDFDAWYEPWRDRMRADPVMRWLVNARNRIEKEGDLDLHSRARVSLLATWEGPLPLIEFDLPPLVSPSDAAASISLEDTPEWIREVGVLILERRWIASDLADHELLEAASHGYGVLAELVDDAHRQVGTRLVSTRVDGERPLVVPTEHIGRRLPCMVATEWRRTVISVADGAEIGRRVTDLPVPSADAEELEERYGRLKPATNVREMAEALFEHARRMFETDGGHVTILLPYREGAPLGPRVFQFEDQRAKFVEMRWFAQDVEREGIDTIFFITESWIATPEQVLPMRRRPSGVPDRKEALFLHGADASGWQVMYTAIAERDSDGRPMLGPTHLTESPPVDGFLAPVLSVWRGTRASEAPPEERDGGRV